MEIGTRKISVTIAMATVLALVGATLFVSPQKALAAKLSKKTSLTVQVRGVPAGATANVLVTGPKKFKRVISRTTTFKKLVPGKYQIKSLAVNATGGRAAPLRTTTKVSISYKQKKKVAVSYSFQPSGSNVTPSGPKTLEFHVRGASAVAVASPSPKARSVAASAGGDEDINDTTLVAVGPDGETHDAIENEVAPVLSTFSSPDGRLFVIFNGTNVMKDGTACAFVEVSKNDDSYSCVDPDVTGLQTLPNYGKVTANPMVQFDAAGSLYYWAYIKGATSTGSYVGQLRKKSGTTVTTLTPTSLYLLDYLVLPDANVLITALNNQTYVMRRITPGNAVNTILSGTETKWMKRFPDGHVYFPGDQWGNTVLRYRTDTHTVDERPYIGRAHNGDVWVEGEFSFQQQCAGSNVPQEWVRTCQSGQPGEGGTFTMSDGTVYGLGRHSSGHSYTLIKAYPTLDRVETSVAEVKSVVQVDDRLVVTGLDENGVAVLVLLDPQTGVETDLLNGLGEGDVYNVAYSKATNTIIWDGLDFGTNQLTLGMYSLESGVRTINRRGTSPWTELVSM